jgi:hypothetical protein
VLCPHCRHSHGLHSGPGHNGRAADGRLLAPDYEAGKCHQGECKCPGWYPDTTPMQLLAATMAARAERNAVAELPFALTAPVARTRRPNQGGLF